MLQRLKYPALIGLVIKSGKNKMLGLKWKKSQNEGTKSAFTLFERYVAKYPCFETI